MQPGDGLQGLDSRFSGSLSELRPTRALCLFLPKLTTVLGITVWAASTGLPSKGWADDTGG